MGWGICFSIDENGLVYCADGCNWKASKDDYADYHPWPSARRAVLEYFEGPGHSELDMIRDECPGTAAALRSACDEYMYHALRYYDNYYTDEEKKKIHEEYLSEFENDVKELKISLEESKKALELTKKSKKEFKPMKAKRRSEHMKNHIDELTMDYEIQVATEELNSVKKRYNLAKKNLKLEKLFDV